MAGALLRVRPIMMTVSAIIAVLFMNRNLAEVALSQQRMLSRAGEREQTRSLRAISSVVEELDQVRSWLRREPNITFLEVDYHRCLAEPSATAASITRFLGRDLDEKAMAAAVEPTLHRNRLAAPSTD